METADQPLRRVRHGPLMWLRYLSEMMLAGAVAWLLLALLFGTAIGVIVVGGDTLGWTDPLRSTLLFAIGLALGVALTHTAVAAAKWLRGSLPITLYLDEMSGTDAALGMLITGAVAVIVGSRFGWP